MRALLVEHEAILRDVIDKASKWAYAIKHLVSRTWITTLLTSEPTSVSARVLFTNALAAEHLLTGEVSNDSPIPTPPGTVLTGAAMTTPTTITNTTPPATTDAV